MLVSHSLYKKSLVQYMRQQDYFHEVSVRDKKDLASSQLTLHSYCLSSLSFFVLDPSSLRCCLFLLRFAISGFLQLSPLKYGSPYRP